jgi:hypothetical protein
MASGLAGVERLRMLTLVSLGQTQQTQADYFHDEIEGGPIRNPHLCRPWWLRLGQHWRSRKRPDWRRSE